MRFSLCPAPPRATKNVGSVLQIKHEKPVVFQDTPTVFSQVRGKSSVMVQPPERGPGNRNVLGSGVPQPLEFANGGVVVFGWAPVFSVSLEERNRMGVRQFAAQLFFIHKNEWFLQRNQANQGFFALFQAARVGPL